MDLESRRRQIARSRRRRKRQLRRRLGAVVLMLVTAFAVWSGSERLLPAEPEGESVYTGETFEEIIKSERETGAADNETESAETEAAEPESRAAANAAVEETLPSRYDLREKQVLGSVRDQGNFGICWAFTSLNALESAMPENLRMHLSAEHMVLKNSFGLGLSDGGDYAISSAYLLAWQGPVAEAEDPYGDGVSPDGLLPVCHVQEILILPEKDYDAIKHAVMTYGGVQSSIFISQNLVHNRIEDYDADTFSYYYHGDSEPNHDVVIVGWDDAFPKENFKTQPENDGAFICMNTWGENFGDGGFFYISYEDCRIGRKNVVYTAVETPENYDTIYQTDLCGWTAQLGYGKSEAWFSNVYEAAADEVIAAAGFYATNMNTEYEVYLARVDEENNEIGKDRILQASGSVTYSGFYTIPLTGDFEVAAGERFAVIVKVDSPGTVEPVAIEYCSGTRTANVDIGDGEGYISFDGEMWQRAETEENCNICLKAYGHKLRGGF